MKKNKIALVCIAYNEDLYIQEWIDYHIKLGFDDIHIFQNNWRMENPCNNENVYLHEYDGYSYKSDEPIWVNDIQAKCYTEFGKKYYDEYEWVAFFDVDEFLVLKKTNNIKDFIKDYEAHDCLIINWAMFGDNGLTTFDKNYTSQIERFTKRQKNIHPQFKSICKINPSFQHQIHWTSGEWIDTKFNSGNGPYNHNGTDEIAQLNHYYIRTYPEFLIKKQRGDNNNNFKYYKPIETFKENNYNEVEDTHALEFLKK